MEFESQLPTLVFTPTIVGDGRRLLMSSQGLSFLTYTPSYLSFREGKTHDAVEFSRLFEEQRAEDLSFLTAIRMSASFPYITPLVNLPSSPSIELIDAGVRDNEGLEVVLRYINEFKDWIKSNTNGVVIIQLKANRPDKVPIVGIAKTKLDQFTLPIGGVIQSFNNLQTYNKSILTKMNKENLDFPLDVVGFSLFDEDDNTSLSWHLTRKEKEALLRTFKNKTNQEQLRKLKALLEPLN